MPTKLQFQKFTLVASSTPLISPTEKIVGGAERARTDCKKSLTFLRLIQFDSIVALPYRAVGD